MNNPKTALIRQAIFHVLDGREWDFTNDEQRVDFADFVVAWLPPDCPSCKGSGEMTVYDTTRGPDGEEATIDCDICGGDGAGPLKALIESIAKLEREEDGGWSPDASSQLRRIKVFAKMLSLTKPTATNGTA